MSTANKAAGGALQLRVRPYVPPATSAPPQRLPRWSSGLRTAAPHSSVLAADFAPSSTVAAISPSSKSASCSWKKRRLDRLIPRPFEISKPSEFYKYVLDAHAACAALKGGIANEVSKLKKQPGKDILVFGSCSLVQTLHNLGLIDEYRLMVFPVVVGSGKRVFQDGMENTVLKLTDTKTFQSGVVVLSYQKA
ncbi:dihydrofolate reductase family protein [Paenibacillus cymbidii]|uniref:dihydrofolate reductase family protein n=1 Tax=Paenibacillus cymbidii TaxID=1639034 RepID=UPI001081BBBC|nr:dihydrofolate reductase family protein [Paenibacillus cymbidii]